jgi:diadenosine tetraphosphate (Ap4A) HIT family hydrolase
MTDKMRDSGENLLKEYPNWALFLHPNQTYLGSSYVMLQREGAIDPYLETTAGERRELMVVIRGLRRCINEVWMPDTYNYNSYHSSNHAEWHVKPRYHNPRALGGELFVDPGRGQGEAVDSPDFYINAQTFATIRDEIQSRLK